MYSGSLPLTGTQSAGSAASSACCQSMSRPACMSACACGRCSRMQLDGLCCAMSMALSTIGLYSMTRLISIPQEAVNNTLGVASSRRTASSSGAKPPNTTVCTAPRRALASIAITASGIIGR